MDKKTIRSKKEGYRARSVFKLMELNSKYRLIKKGNSVFDIGCWPGSWLQYCANLGCKVSGIDLKEVEGFETIKGDIMKVEIEGSYDVVLSDVAPKTTGIISLDQENSLELSSRSFEIAYGVLKKDGNFLCKVFNGESVKELVSRIKKRFRIVKLVRADNSRRRSKEVYIVAKGYRKS